LAGQGERRVARDEAQIPIAGKLTDDLRGDTDTECRLSPANGKEGHDRERGFVWSAPRLQGGALCWHEHITFAADGAENAPLIIADRLPDVGDALRQRILGNGDVVPDPIHQLVLADEAAGILGKKAQHRVGTRPDLDMLARRGP
jgi:hypothetical protein